MATKRQFRKGKERDRAARGPLNVADERFDRVLHACGRALDRPLLVNSGHAPLLRRRDCVRRLRFGLR
jgi:hypothetical protein